MYIYISAYIHVNERFLCSMILHPSISHTKLRDAQHRERSPQRVAREDQRELYDFGKGRCTTLAISFAKPHE